MTADLMSSAAPTLQLCVCGSVALCEMGMLSANIAAPIRHTVTLLTASHTESHRTHGPQHICVNLALLCKNIKRRQAACCNFITG